MRKITIVLIAVFAFMTFYSSYGICQDEAIDEAGIINDICPVMGGKVDKDTPYSVEYKGEKIGFCCAGCVDTFNADPETYLQKIEKKCMIKCPKCGAEIDVVKQCKESGIICPSLEETE